MKISIIVPVYNEEETIQNCLEDLKYKIIKVFINEK